MKLPRRNSHKATILDSQENPIYVGGGAPVMVQSMTNTDTADIQGSIAQIKALADAGSEVVRITVNNEESAAAVPAIREGLDALGCYVPIVGDFHYNGHRLLADYPEMAAALAKYRINPGNVGFGAKQDSQFAQMIEKAIEHDKPIRIGVNWGSLDQKLLATLMDENGKLDNPLPPEEVGHEALVRSALDSAAKAEAIGMKPEQILLSCKVSRVQDLITVYRMIASRCDYALHLGLTEAGMGSKGITASAAALAVLLQEGIGDTIRISLTPEPNGDRTQEVIVAQELLQAMGIRSFTPTVTACPGCGRTTSTTFQVLAEKVQKYLRQNIPAWSAKYGGEVAAMEVAVMGCIVNGPGESKHANIGISLPGTGEAPTMPVFEDGKKTKTLKGDDAPEQFLRMIDAYVERNYGDAA